MKFVRKRNIICILVGMISLMLIGCGTVSIDLYTTVEPSGDFNQRIRIEGTGMIGDLLITSETIQNAEADGWNVSTSREGDSSIFDASKEFHNENEFVIINDFQNGGSLKLKDINSHTNNGLIFKEYYFEATMPGTPMDFDENNEYAALGEAFLNSMFNMFWTLDLPGNIVETNADTYDETTATWYFGIKSLENDRKIIIRTKDIQWTNIYIGGGALIVLIGLLIILVFKKKRAY